MSDKINTNGKMKIVGYTCYAFAAVLSLMGVLEIRDTEISMVLPLVNTWLAAGTTLLFGNSAKHLVGEKLKVAK